MASLKPGSPQHCGAVLVRGTGGGVAPEPCVFTCEVCSRCFSSLDQVVAHPCGGAEKPPVQYQCRFCPYTSHVKWRVGRHEKTHTGYRPFACPHCGQRFTESGSLKRHLRMRARKGFCELRKKPQPQPRPSPRPQGRDPGPFVCPECGKAFTRKAGLDLHALRHAQERPYACGVCQRRFADPGNASRHEKAVHGRQYPLHCPHCGQGCWHQPHLRRHLRTQHRGTLPPQEEQEAVSAGGPHALG